MKYPIYKFQEVMFPFELVLLTQEEYEINLGNNSIDMLSNVGSLKKQIQEVFLSQSLYSTSSFKNV